MKQRTLIALACGAFTAACAISGETPAPDAGQKLYARHCLSCHQADGYGVPNMQPAITGGAWVKGDAKALASFVITGGFDSSARKESDNENVMPPFRQLSDGDLAQILSYIRAKFGSGAAPVSAAEVAAARASVSPGS
jgi:mono/diheme cytochrome c family protein